MAKEKKLTYVNPSYLTKNPENPRIIFRQEDLDALLRSINQVGIQVPLSIYKSSKNKFIILDGERRWRCAMKLGLKEVPVIIEPKPSTLENLLMMFNIHNVRISWELIALAEKLKRVKELVEKERKVKITYKDLSDLTGVTLSTIKRCDELLELPEKFKRIIWKELEKPKSEQKFTEDLFLEINKSIKTINSYLPEIIEENKNKRLLELFFSKYKNGIVTNRVEFRDISKIARGSRVGVSKSKILRVLNKFINDKHYTINEAFNESVADAYSDRNIQNKIKDIIEIVKSTDMEDIDRSVFNLLNRLRKELNRKLKEDI